MQYSAMPRSLNANTAAALLSALHLARRHGGAHAALEANGISLLDAERIDGLAGDFASFLGSPAGDKVVAEALALGFVAGRVARRPRARTLGDPTCFLMDRDLLVQTAEGESVLRLPWFEDGLFVGRQLPEIHEMPARVRKLCVNHYSAALAGQRGRFAFTSYGHAYSVEALPVRAVDGEVEAVLAIATPGRPYASAAAAYEKTAERLDRSATHAEQRADLHAHAGRGGTELVERRAARKARDAADRARAIAERMRLREAAASPDDAPPLTPREIEVLQLASHGLPSAEIAEHLGVSLGTIRTHFQNVYPKLGVNSKAAAVAAALRYGLID
ncbi:MAG: hypothetical protein QOG63_2525 [Thermoleophilaceae bacterium]|jgi:DNA-binding CsgD family transcriptional regulator|nr:hypothetical protein [Thermoleophilaceae bacterium]